MADRLKSGSTSFPASAAGSKTRKGRQGIWRLHYQGTPDIPAYFEGAHTWHTGCAAVIGLARYIRYTRVFMGVAYPIYPAYPGFIKRLPTQQTRRTRVCENVAYLTCPTYPAYQTYPAYLGVLERTIPDTSDVTLYFWRAYPAYPDGT